MAKLQNAYLGNPGAGAEWSVEPHWDDLLGSEAQGAAGAALTFATLRDTPFKVFAFRDAQNDELHLKFQFPHGWDPGTDYNFHIHSVPLADPGAPQVVRFEGQYAWATAGVVPANAGWTTFVKEVTINPGDVFKQIVFKLFEDAPPAEATESSILLVYVKRAGGHANDTYAANIGILSLDVHMQRVKIGTLDEIPEIG